MPRLHPPSMSTVFLVLVLTMWSLATGALVYGAITLFTAGSGDLSLIAYGAALTAAGQVGEFLTLAVTAIYVALRRP